MNIAAMALFMAVFSAAALPAQQDSVVVRGTILDRVTGRPLVGAHLAFSAEGRGWTVADTLGRFVLSPKRRKQQKLLVTCPRPREAWGATLDSIAIELRPGLDTTIVVQVASALCDMPAFAERRLELTGLFSAGFEENRFFPDADSTGRPPIWGGNAGGRHAVVGWSARGLAQRPPWPDPPEGVGSSSCYRVHWVGTLTGPGLKNPTPAGFISMGRIANYSFVVDSTIELKAVARSACDRP